METEMVTVKHYESPLGEILLAADETGLIGLWFMGQKYFARTLPKTCRTGDSPILDSASKWLSIYFSGNIPSFTPPLHLIGTEFQTVVWNHLLSIPYGTTVTYSAIGKRIAAGHGGTRFSAQAVGGAVGHNPISIIIPCHRVVAANGSLTGYAGGILRKVKLLTLEKANMHSLFIPKKGTAL